MPNVPIQTGKKQFRDSFGNDQDTTKASALGPPTDQAEPRYQPIRVWNPSRAHDEDWRTATKEPQSGYTSSVDLAPKPQMAGTDGQPVEHAGSDNHPLNRTF